MQELIIGAAIAFISSLLILITTNIFQSRRDSAARKWLLEDQRNERKRAILQQRAKDAELFVDNMFNACHHLSSAIASTARAGSYSERNQGLMDGFNKMLMDATAKQAYVFYLNDPQLDEQGGQLVELSESLMNKSWEILQRRQDTQFELEASIKSLLTDFAKIGQLRIQMISRIDELSANY
jgi:hypothetical protein